MKHRKTSSTGHDTHPRRKRLFPSHDTLLLPLILLLLSLQGCLGIGINTGSGTGSGFKVIHRDARTQQVISINQSSPSFHGSLYFTQGRNLYVLDSKGQLRQLSSGADVRDPAVSPDGKYVAAIIHYKNYSDLVYMPTSGGSWNILRSGAGHFYQDGSVVKNTFYWYAQPEWSQDGSHLLFLSDFEKEKWYSATNQDAPLLDLQVFSIPFNTPTATPQDVAYADFGDGGNRDASYRPGHSDQIIYTHYTYDKTGTNQVIQLFFENANAIANTPGTYHPGIEGSGLDPAVPLSPTSTENIQPAFSPDGNALAYVRRDSNGQVSLYVMSLPTQDVTATPNDPKVQQDALVPYQHSSLLLTQDAMGQPVWSPDGKEIAFLCYSNNEYNLWLTQVAYNNKTNTYSIQGQPVQLTAGGLDGDSRPFWTL